MQSSGPLRWHWSDVRPIGPTKYPPTLVGFRIVAGHFHDARWSGRRIRRQASINLLAQRRNRSLPRRLVISSHRAPSVKLEEMLLGDMPQAETLALLPLGAF